MLSAQILIHTQIVDIDRFNIRHDVVILILLKDTESVSEHLILFIHRHENRPQIVMNQLLQLFVRIFLLIVPEQIRPPVMMHLFHLHQKLVNPFHIFFLCSSYFHFQSSPIFPAGLHFRIPAHGRALPH